MCGNAIKNVQGLEGILGLAKIYLSEENLEQAMLLLEEIFESDKDGKAAAEAYYVLSAYYERKQEPGRALKFYKKYSELKLKSTKNNAELNIYSNSLTYELKDVLKDLK